MTSQFDVIIPRRGSGSYKWDSSDDPQSLPMWVADMDFRTAPAIIEALSDRVAHGVFGYTKVPDAYYEALGSWFANRHGFQIERDWVIYTSGVVPAISAILKALTRPGERVLIQTPVYNCFYSSIANMGCIPLENVLIAGEDGHYGIDFEDLEAKAAEPDVHVMLLCNPHNPVGRSWRAEELSRIGDICLRHGVTVVSDEIHCDLTFPGHTHHPFATIKQEFLAASVTCISPSKAFNIAGLQIANIVVTDEELRSRIGKAINIHEVCDVNPFGVAALIAAYREGGSWLDELRGYLQANYQTVSDFIASNMPTLRLTQQEATYLAWIDCRALSLSSDAIEARLATEGHLLVNSGTLYGAAGEGYIRLNMACPRAQLLDGLERMQTVLTQ
ncbi:MalY/PatB family protein [Cohaesibacter marisflavi]|uniref:MalY/PatB family protein n=1 Tax=Cohaesibacter marisflavi TaxID=655353 RepID=UPI0029C7867C|nr:MalY/PatB family protein [Cohaesibacter marisflavi]